MPTLEQTLKQKADRLSTVPDKFLTRAAKAEKELLNDLISLLADLERKNGFIVQSSENLQLASLIIDQLQELFTAGEYGQAVAEFAQEFEDQFALSTEYFEKAFRGFTIPEFAVTALEKSRNNAVSLLLNARPQADFFTPLKETIENAIVSGARYNDMFDVLEPFFVGDKGGRISQYSNVIAHDAFAIADREYMSIVSDEIDAEWFLYLGGTVEGTRPFCQERNDKYFHYKEIEGWVDGKRQPGQMTPTGKGTWAGMIEGTTEQTIYSYAGGWNCRHSIIPVSIFVVPKSVIQRNMQSGNFEPSNFEREELGL